MKQPKNTFENRTQLGQPQIPDNINMEPNPEKILSLMMLTASSETV